jgi:uncharacterized repeat protein (TIGR03803 family)
VSQTTPYRGSSNSFEHDPKAFLPFHGASAPVGHSAHIAYKCASWQCLAELLDYSFCSQWHCADGTYPEVSLIAANGNLYGTTLHGGAYGYGAVFVLKKKRGIMAQTPQAFELTRRPRRPTAGRLACSIQQSIS